MVIFSCGSPFRSIGTIRSGGYSFNFKLTMWPFLAFKLSSKRLKKLFRSDNAANQRRCFHAPVRV
jgi:hypothetical protein